METVKIILQITTLFGIGSIFLFRKFLFSYSSEKGKNLATKEDIEDITRKVESTKNEYIADIERLKVELSLVSRKHDILLDEKIRVFKKLQKRLVDFKKYCEAAIGSYDSRGDFHMTLEALDANIDKSALLHLTALHEIEQEDFIFLSEISKAILSELHNKCSMMCSMELAVCANSEDKDIIESTIPVYDAAMLNIDLCLQSLYEELEFPSKEKER
ncbi:hypothetical protein CRN32_11000 [Vibrio vulnificus]|uniref:hypothetical protein n=1 Tax=Vibrio vulnificus TaxID=672 RepID=UPI000CD05341|nr:hypothetical protein [Vibrio vulnificus]EJG0735678.1 hypothetical protein [Vibrio parahaemolyticus]EJG0791042.1 hypothetical protein [Vibrio parahaemolyticus]ELH9603149.1 hypothetical protein [Vibrio vulnificus]ELH9617487.1 hypothetical protein [Vibrio vulnificus]MCU8221337.1 hypothetical protein [Vibrio vulnificus]